MNTKRSKRSRGPSLAFVILATTVVASACATDEVERAKTPTPDYITLTYTHDVEQEGEDETRMDMELWEYDPATTEAVRRFATEYTSQYPLGFYDKAHQVAYYTKQSEQGGDQIYRTDLQTNEETALTEPLTAVNYIYPLEDRVLFVACLKGMRNLRLGAIDKKTGDISYWEPEPDMEPGGSRHGGVEDASIEAFTVDEAHERIYLSVFSEGKRQHSIENQNNQDGQNNFQMPIHTVYETDYALQHTESLFSEPEWVRTVMANGDHVLALSDKRYNDPTGASTLIDYDREHRSIVKTPWTASRLQVGDANYASDGKIIYGIAIVDDKRGLYAYDIDTASFTARFVPEDGFVNNITVVKR
ncbi:hypothetical protein [Paenibacillus sp. 598K]|uniref:hypothetical protein n=1 Tax=Paenibacillus sp. 598K TaxID=1117987 RepID=UPI000FFF3EC4|nr:hypothetical protein [Paenibacillus sp. 598K]